MRLLKALGLCLLAIAVGVGTAYAAYSHIGDWTVSGKVGVGTDAPAHLIHANSNSNASARLRLQNNEGFYDILTDNNTFQILNSSGGWTARSLSNGDLVISGYAGLGTPAPEKNLHVYDNTTASVRMRIENQEGYADLFTNDSNFGVISFDGYTEETELLISPSLSAFTNSVSIGGNATVSGNQTISGTLGVYDDITSLGSIVAVEDITATATLRSISGEVQFTASATGPKIYRSGYDIIVRVGSTP